jgi:flavorubredoxin
LGKIIFATTTYNGEIFPFMREFINHLTERNFSNRKVGFIENGSWAPVATKVMKAMFEKSKNITFAENEVEIMSAVNEQSISKIKELAKELV